LLKRFPTTGTIWRKKCSREANSGTYAAYFLMNVDL